MYSTPVYAVIDLGSSYIRGMIAQKIGPHEISPILYEELPSNGYVRNGAVHSIDGTASIIEQLLERLNERLENNYQIKRLYVGLGARSLRSLQESVQVELSEEGEEISDTHLESIHEQIASLQYPGKAVIHVTEPNYIVDGQPERYPRSVVAHTLAAEAQVIICDELVYTNLKKVVEERLQLELASVIVSPLAEANLALTPQQKEFGWTYVNVGGGCTSVSVYSQGHLRFLRILPFGGINVTKDITSLRFSFDDAERIKIEQASATTSSDRDREFVAPAPDGQGERIMRSIDVNRYATARMREIVANVVAIVANSGVANRNQRNSGGYLFGGGGAEINKFGELLRQELRNYSLHQSFDSFLDRNNALCFDLPRSFFTCVALVDAATEDCVGTITSSIAELMSGGEDHSTQQDDRAASPSKGPTRFNTFPDEGEEGDFDPDYDNPEGDDTSLEGKGLFQRMGALFTTGASTPNNRDRKKREEKKANKTNPFSIFLDGDDDSILDD